MKTILVRLVLTVPFVSFTAFSEPVSPTIFARDQVDIAKLHLEVDYQANILEDVSADGRLLLFYETSTPFRTYSVSTAGGSVPTNQALNDDSLRIVEQASGRELARTPIGFFPQNPRFIPNSTKVFFLDQTNVRGQYQFTTWDYSKGISVRCPNVDALNFRHSIPVSNERVLGAVLQKSGGEVLATLDLPACRVSLTEPVNPNFPTKQISDNISLSPDGRSFLYEAGNEVVVRDSKTLGLKGIIRPPAGLLFGNQVEFDSAGKVFVIPASNTGFDRADTRRYLILYSTSDFSFIKQWDITVASPPVSTKLGAFSSVDQITAFDVSSGGRWAAISYTSRVSGHAEEAIVSLVELKTGQIVAKVIHSTGVSLREDPFAAKIIRLRFSPDDKFLFGSTHYTRVWKLGPLD